MNNSIYLDNITDNDLIKYSIHKAIHSGRDMRCPRCNSKFYVKNGTFKGVQRYICKDCRKSFCEHTNTPWYYSKKDFSLWLKYFNNMMNKCSSLRTLANKMEFSLVTSFKWRHKILEYMISNEKGKKLRNKIALHSNSIIKMYYNLCDTHYHLTHPVMVHLAMDLSENINIFSERMENFKDMSKASIIFKSIDKNADIFVYINRFSGISSLDTYKVIIDTNDHLVDKVRFLVFRFIGWKKRFSGIPVRNIGKYLYWYVIKSCKKTDNQIKYLSKVI